MATKKTFQVEIPLDDATTPFIYRTADEEGVTWREAKKLLRNWYLIEARKLRSYSEKEFNVQEQLLATDGENKVEPVSSPV